MKQLLAKAKTPVAALLIGLSGVGLICSNASLVRAEDPKTPQFNATITDPPARCRFTPGGKVKMTFSRGVVSLSTQPRQSSDGKWYLETLNGCYIHESVFRWGT